MDSTTLAKQIRLKSLQLVYKAKASHIGGAFSIADVLAVLYNDILNFDSAKPDLPSRDRLLYSKGHSCTALYSTLYFKGFFEECKLDEFSCDGSYFTSHVNHNVPGIELSTGSLGHALSVGCGLALAAKRKNKEWRTFVILSDGELDEGSNWEGFLFAPHHRLDNLTVIVDYNKIQSFGTIKDVLNLEPLYQKFQSFGWSVLEIDGHNHQEIYCALTKLPICQNKPTVIIANTIKGKGVKFMEGELAWHYKSPNDDQYKQAVLELDS